MTISKADLQTSESVLNGKEAEQRAKGSMKEAFSLGVPTDRRDKNSSSLAKAASTLSRTPAAGEDQDFWPLMLTAIDAGRAQGLTGGADVAGQVGEIPETEARDAQVKGRIRSDIFSDKAAAARLEKRFIATAFADQRRLIEAAVEKGIADALAKTARPLRLMR